MSVSQRKNFEVAAPMKRIIKDKTTSFKFREARPEIRKQTLKNTDEMRKYSRDRSQWESPANNKSNTNQKAVNKLPAADYRDKHKTADRQKIDIKKTGNKDIPNKEYKRVDKKSEKSKNTIIKAFRKKESSNVSQGEEKEQKSDNVKVKTSPVVDKRKGSFFRKKAPSQPDEEKERRRIR